MILSDHGGDDGGLGISLRGWLAGWERQAFVTRFDVNSRSKAVNGLPRSIRVSFPFCHRVNGRGVVSSLWADQSSWLHFCRQRYM